MHWMMIDAKSLFVFDFLLINMPFMRQLVGPIFFKCGIASMNHYFWSSYQNKNWFTLGQTSDMKERQHMDMNYCRTLFKIRSKMSQLSYQLFKFSWFISKNGKIVDFSWKIQNRENDTFLKIFKHCDFYDILKKKIEA